MVGFDGEVDQRNRIRLTVIEIMIIILAGLDNV